MRNIILLIVLVLLFIPLTSADYTTNGSTGWANTSYSNFAYDRNTGYLILPDNTTDGLVLYQKMSGSSGITSYDMNETSNNSGTLVNMSIGLDNGTSGWNSSGEWGNVISFDGVDDSVDMGDKSSCDLGQAITLQAQVNRSGDGSSEFPAIVTKRADVNNAYSLRYRPTNVAQFFLGSGSEYKIISTDGDLNVGTSYNLCGVWDGTNMSLYLDGVVQTNTETTSGTPDTSGADLWIGMFKSGSLYPFEGILYSVRIYNRALTNDEINQTMNNTMKTTDNVTHWHDAGNGYQTASFIVNMTTPTNTNYTVWYANNGSSFSQIGGTYTGNQTPSISGTKYQNTDLRIMMNGNSTATPEEIEVSFITAASVGSVDIVYYNLDYTNLTANVNINISNKTEPLTFINISHIGNLSSEYCLNYPNSTIVQSCVSCTGEGDTIWFNGSADRLPELDGYYINETLSSINTSNITIPANSWGMFNNWTAATIFSAIAANESNDICYTYYNVTTGEWDSYYDGYSWNANYQIPLKASVMMYVNAETTVTATIVTPSSTELYTGWNQLFVQGTDNETISNIIANIGANCTDAWWFNSTAEAYSNTTTDTVQPNQGFLTYITQNMTWTRSDL